MRVKLQNYLKAQIPIVNHMGIEVLEASDQCVQIKALLQPNSNHKSTAFGGSIQTITTLACWGFLYVQLAKKHPGSQIVIVKSQVDFKKPICSDFIAKCDLKNPEDITKLESSLQRKGRGKISLDSYIYQEGLLAAHFQGIFAAHREK